MRLSCERFFSLLAVSRGRPAEGPRDPHAAGRRGVLVPPAGGGPAQQQQAPAGLLCHLAGGPRGPRAAPGLGACGPAHAATPSTLPLSLCRPTCRSYCSATRRPPRAPPCASWPPLPPSSRWAAACGPARQPRRGGGMPAAAPCPAPAPRLAPPRATFIHSIISVTASLPVPRSAWCSTRSPQSAGPTARARSSRPSSPSSSGRGAQAGRACVWVCGWLALHSSPWTLLVACLCGALDGASARAGGCLRP